MIPAASASPADLGARIRATQVPPTATIQRIDQAHAKNQQPARDRGEALPRDAYPDLLIDQHGEAMYRQWKSNGDQVPIPAHTPADHSQAEIFQSGAASRERSDDDGGQERPKRSDDPNGTKLQVIT